MPPRTKSSAAPAQPTARPGSVQRMAPPDPKAADVVAELRARVDAVENVLRDNGLLPPKDGG